MKINDQIEGMIRVELTKIRELSIANKKSLEQIGLKLSEETGEVSQALLSYIGANGSEYKKLGSEDVKEECIDVVMVALSLFYKIGGTDEELSSVINKKTEKWEELSVDKTELEELSELVNSCVGKRFFYKVGEGEDRVATCVAISMDYRNRDKSEIVRPLIIGISPYGHSVRLYRSEISYFED